LHIEDLTFALSHLLPNGCTGSQPLVRIPDDLNPRIFISTATLLSIRLVSVTCLLADQSYDHNFQSQHSLSISRTPRTLKDADLLCARIGSSPDSQTISSLVALQPKFNHYTLCTVDASAKMVKNWEPLKEEIKKLCHTEDKPLKEVMRLMKGKYDFHAS
jgi:hypothetical protein